MEDIILFGDVYSCLDILDDNSVAVAITSPPYWQQRDYGFEGQIGKENTPEDYIGKLVTIFNKLRKKLREDGIFFLNVGDKYLSKYGKSHLLQIPYRLAFHMSRNGWYLEDIIIWYKPNHMPSSVKDRFTNTYEPVLVLSKTKSNIYERELGNVVEIPLQQTPWQHTAVFPERLVEELLKRVILKDGDLILDPFAGTGTVGFVVNKLRDSLFSKMVFSVLIEKSDFFVSIIKERTKIAKVKKAESLYYNWEPVKEEKLPSNIIAKELLNDKYGEVFITDRSEEFLSILKGMTTETFKKFHKENALYCFGVKNWTLLDLYYSHSVFYEGYVLRNMIINSDGKNWYPVFMFAKDTTKSEYRFYLDRIRITHKTKENRIWKDENFLGVKVSDVSSKKPREGQVINVLERYEDGFPKIGIVKWNGQISVEFILHPNEDEFIMEGLIYRCPKCLNELEEPYESSEDNFCPHCGASLWLDPETLPIIEEPQEVAKAVDNLYSIPHDVGEVFEIEEFERLKRNIRSKFSELERINWGASPGARKLMLGEYFSKMRLYRLDQPTVAQYLTVLRKAAGLSIQDLVNKFPTSYKHTIGHWFRKDFGGSIPLPDDLVLIQKAFETTDENLRKLLDTLLRVLGRTALKFQTVKMFVKGKNPGDFQKMDDGTLKSNLEMLYIPSEKYLKMLKSSDN